MEELIRKKILSLKRENHLEKQERKKINVKLACVNGLTMTLNALYYITSNSM